MNRSYVFGYNFGLDGDLQIWMNLGEIDKIILWEKTTEFWLLYVSYFPTINF